MADNGTPMNSLERSTLRTCEKVIDAHCKTFLQVGSALMQINSEALYRATHQSFGAYCESRWGFTKRRAYQLIEGAEIGHQVGTMVHDATPESQPPTPIGERQVRPLAKLPEEKRAMAWTDAVESAGGSQPTSTQVTEVVESYLADDDETPDDEDPPEDDPEDGEPEPTTDELVKEHDKAIEAFCRAVSKAAAKKNRPDVEWLDHKGRWEGFMRKLKQGLETLRSAKAVVCPACEGDGCKECLKLGYLPKVEAESISV